MKWREPKVEGVVTAKTILLASAAAFVVSLPFGFLGGRGKFNGSIWLTALCFLATAPLSLCLVPLLPGRSAQLRENMITIGPRGSKLHKSAYQNIEWIFYTRNCRHSQIQSAIMEDGRLKSLSGPTFTHFQVVNKEEDYSSVRQFAVPDEVDLEKVLQILRGKGIKVAESSPGEEPSIPGLPGSLPGMPS